jgi:hypothetical protein
MCAHTNVGSPVNKPVVTPRSATCKAKFAGRKKVVQIDFLDCVRIDVQVMQGIRITSGYQQ